MHIDWGAMTIPLWDHFHLLKNCLFSNISIEAYGWKHYCASICMFLFFWKSRHIRNFSVPLGEANGVIASGLWLKKKKKVHTTFRPSLFDHSHNPPHSFSYPIGCPDAKEPVEKTRGKKWGSLNDSMEQQWPDTCRKKKQALNVKATDMLRLFIVALVIYPD